MAGIIPGTMRLYVADLYSLVFCFTVIYCILGTYQHMGFIVQHIYSQLSVHAAGLCIWGHDTVIKLFLVFLCYFEMQLFNTTKS